MRIFILPVSGGGFPIQLSYIAELADAGVKPDLVLGSSGGNLAGYIGLASHWQSSNIPNVIQTTNLNTSNFAMSWWPWGFNKIFPSWMIGYYRGSFYAPGTGAQELFNKMFTPQTVVQTEMWSGTLNRDQGKGQMFCNRSKDESVIGKLPEPMETLWTRDCLPLRYANGDLNLLSQVTLASASIPVLVPEQNIEGSGYVDGGTIFASPLSALVDYLYSVTLAQGHGCHLDYINSYDIQSAGSTKPTNLLTTGYATVGELMKNICLADRQNGIDLVRSGPEQVYFAVIEGSIKNLKIIEEIRKFAPRSLLELYPTVGQERCLDLLSFTAKDILNIFNSNRESYYLRFWWALDVEISAEAKIAHEKIHLCQKLPKMRYGSTRVMEF